MNKQNKERITCPQCKSVAWMELLKPVKRENGEELTKKCNDCGRIY